jgi:hypothetical protein
MDKLADLSGWLGRLTRSMAEVLRRTFFQP